MAATYQIPGGPYVNDDVTSTVQIAGAQYIVLDGGGQEPPSGGVPKSTKLSLLGVG